jgi:hypothetical protein
MKTLVHHFEHVKGVSWRHTRLLFLTEQASVDLLLGQSFLWD